MTTTIICCLLSHMVYSAALKETFSPRGSKILQTPAVALTDFSGVQGFLEVNPICYSGQRFTTCCGASGSKVALYITFCFVFSSE